MWVPVAVWQPCELLYTCYFLTYLDPLGKGQFWLDIGISSVQSMFSTIFCRWQWQYGLLLALLQQLRVLWIVVLAFHHRYVINRSPTSSTRDVAFFHSGLKWHVQWIFFLSDTARSSSFFTCVLLNKEHVLHTFLPDTTEIPFHLRPRRHSLILSTKNCSVIERDFIIRMMFKDVH